MIHKKLFLGFFFPLKDLNFIIYSPQMIFWNCETLFSFTDCLDEIFFYRVFLQLCSGCFVISTDLDRYLSRGLTAQSATISMRYSALGVEMVLQHSWRESTNPSMVKDDVMWHPLYMRLLILLMLQWADGSFTNLT